MSSSKIALIPIMNAQYEQIAAIESAWQIRFAEGDMRPRIEHFHDAVRALTSGETPYGKQGRLTVEYLAYDVAQLRAIQANPLGRLHKGAEKVAGSALIRPDQLTGASETNPRAVRADLAQRYKDYTVLFVALFAETADINFKSRKDEMDMAVGDIAQVKQILTQLAKGQIHVDQAQLLLGQVEQDNLREQVQQMLSQHQLHSHGGALMQRLGQLDQKLGAEGAALDKAHLSYVTGQLAVYEEAKETIKRLAAQGMNLAGKFVENAMQQSAGRGAGRNV